METLSICIRYKQLLYPKTFRQMKMVFEGHFEISASGINMYSKKVQPCIHSGKN